MHTTTGLPPWARSRAERHLARGCSPRVIRFIIQSRGAEPAPAPEAAPILDLRTAGPNVVPFRGAQVAVFGTALPDLTPA